MGRVYFRQLFEASLALAGQMPLTLEPAPMAHVTDVLEPAVERARTSSPFVAPDRSVLAAHVTALNEAAGPATGLNTVGLMLDRLSILAAKHWNLTHRSNKPEAATELERTQIAELATALAEARPGHSSINNKMTNRQVQASSANFTEAYYGLFTTNLLLWEAQEVLYNHDIAALPCEELRAYIDFFSRGNLARNKFIQSSDELFWDAVR
ncbi:MAG: hypothetical protein ACYDD1_05800, partial [Caulobacteraceae bacterium]